MSIFPDKIPESTSKCSVAILIEDILESGSLNVIGGHLDAGKTTFAFHMIKALMGGSDLFGKKSVLSKIAYVSTSRNKTSAYPVMRRLGIDPANLQLVDGIGDTFQIFDLPDKLHPGVEIVFIEDLHLFQPNGMSSNDLAPVGRFMREVREKLCHVGGLTVIGTLRGAKGKEGSKISIPGERLAGSVEWGGQSDTKIYIEKAKPENPANHERRIWIMPKFAPQSMLMMELGQAGFIGVAPEIDESSMNLLFSLPPNQAIDMNFLLQAASRIGIDGPKAGQIVQDMVKAGDLKSAGTAGLFIRESKLQVN